MSNLRVALVACTLASLASPAVADQWPQWMGPKRDNIWREEGIIKEFPEGGPKILWRTPVAGGYAGPAVVDGRVYVMDYVTSDDVKIANFERKPSSGTERILCLDEATGKELWKVEYPVGYDISYPAGPRCTPTVDGDRVYFLGAEGDFVCMDIAKGTPVWEKNLKKAYGTTSALWGYAAHPLIDGDKIITLAGGEGSHVVAFNKMTGAEIWKAGSQKEQGYVPPSIIHFAGKRQLVIAGPTATRSYDPDTGERYWSVPYEATNGSIIMTPVVQGEHMYVGGYSGKTQMLKLDAAKPGASVVWENKRNLGISPVNVQPFGEDGVIYGHDESGKFFAVEVPSGKRLWEGGGPLGDKAQGSGTSFIVKQAGRFWFFTEFGDLVIGKLSKTGYEEIDRAKGLLEPTGKCFGRKVVWCQPAYANKRAYIRNDKEIICVDLAK
jgi:outer membrane protein assembly factor BamB